MNGLMTSTLPSRFWPVISSHWEPVNSFSSACALRKSLTKPSSTAGWLSSVVLLLLKRGGQHPPHTFESEIIDDTSGAVTVQVHPIKAPADGFLDGLLTGDVLQVACPPEGHLVLPFGLGEGTEIEVGVVFSHWLSHFQGSPWSAHRSMWSCGHRIPPEQRRPR